MFIYPIYYHNWRNISTVYIYKKTSIERNTLTIKKIHREVGRTKDLSAPHYFRKDGINKEHRPTLCYCSFCTLHIETK